MHDKQQVYVIASQGRVKIGRSGIPAMRCVDIANSNVEDCTLFYTTKMFPKKAAGIIEKIAHKLCGEHRLKGEWFAMSPEAATAEVKKAARLFATNKYEDVFKKKEWNDYNYQRLNVVLRPTDQRLILELGWVLEKEADTSFSQSDIIRLALREMAIARGVECK